MYLLRVLLLIGTFLTLARSEDNFEDGFEFHVEEEDKGNILDNNDWDSEFPKIAGGGTTEIDEVKYIAYIIKPQNTTICNGFLIARKWVLTSAQCVAGISAINITVRLGSVNRLSGGTLVNVTSISMYMLSNNATLENDYALIELSQLVNYSTTIQKIELPPVSSSLPIIGFVRVFGWGVTDSGSAALQDTLRGVKLGFISRPLCRKLYGNTFNVTDTMFCAGTFIFGGKGACSGDIGGPAVYHDVAIGLVTLAHCGQPKKPTVFSRTSTIIPWINGVAGVLT